VGLWVTIRIALRALRKNKMRSALTVLGIVIGIAAVTTMVSIGESASALVQGQFETLGTNVLAVFPGAQRHGGIRQGRAQTLTAADARAIKAECESVLAASPIFWTAGQVVFANANWSPNEMLGVGPDYLTVRNWQLRLGGFISQRDVTSANKVCVVGQTIVAKLFQTRNPLGETIRVKNVPLKIIGVLEAKGANLGGEDQDSIVLIPHTTVKKRLQGSSFDNVHAIMVSARSIGRMSDAQNEVTQLLYERHGITPTEPPDFQVRNMTEIAEILGVVTGTMTALLASIAGISLLVGGVGIMNIMLVSVTERTREIGIRMAVGARSGDILGQFLVESVMLCSIGGLMGLALGIAASIGITSIINSITPGTEWPLVISLPAAVVAMVFALAVGVTFGFYPALRASRMDPIEALRYE
jgi:putative ABC transport system permease protein